MQGKIIKSHAGPALTMASTILCAGVFLGVMQQTEIMTHMANVLANVVPQSMGRFLPLIVGLVSVPLTLMFDTDSFFFGMLPVLIGIGNEFGVNPAHIAIAMVVCRNCATFISRLFLLLSLEPDLPVWRSKITSRTVSSGSGV